KIVDNDRNSSAHIFSSEPSGWRAFVYAKRFSRTLSRSGFRYVVSKVSNLLLPAVFKELHFFRLQIGNRLATLVGDDSIDLHQICGDANDIDVFGLLGLRFLRWKWRWRGHRLLSE